MSQNGTNLTSNRPDIDSTNELIAPFPITLVSEVVKGFGRGSKELGIPTANYPQEYVDSVELVDLETGIYYGYSQILSSQLDSLSSAQDDEIFPMVMSLGWNPYYKNDKRSAEVHVIHDYGRDFYGQTMKTVVLGFIRPERSYNSLDDLIADIKFDIKFSLNSLSRSQYTKEAIQNLF